MQITYRRIFATVARKNSLLANRISLCYDLIYSPSGPLCFNLMYRYLSLQASFLEDVRKTPELSMSTQSLAGVSHIASFGDTMLANVKSHAQSPQWKNSNFTILKSCQ